MRKSLCLILFLGWFVALHAANTIDIPLKMSVSSLVPAGSPGSTPDPTDPNQFRVTLSGNMLTITTMHDAASYIVIRTDFCEPLNEDYFYSLSFDSVTCPITQSGTYAIHIGCWNTDFAGFIIVKSIYLYDFAGKQYPISMLSDQLPPGTYFIRVVTDKGTTTTKIRKQ